MSSLSTRSDRSVPWIENPTAELVRLAWPIAVSMLSFGTMTLVDTLFVGRIGPAALAGVGLGGTLAFALVCFSLGLLRGTKVLVSQAVGAGRHDRLGSILGAGLLLAALLGALTLVMGQLCGDLLLLLAATEEAGQAARSYFVVRTLGAPIVLGLVALRELRYGTGDTRTPMVASLVANAANVGLDWLFIFGLDQGVPGSAWATILCQLVELLTLVWVTRRALPIPTLRLETVRQVLRVGVPTGGQFVLEVGSFALLTTIVSLLGEVQMAAHQICLQVCHFSFLPALALGEAASVMAGQAVGANRDPLVMRVARTGTLAASVYTGAWTLVMVLLGPLIVSVFTDDPELAQTASRLLLVAACFQVADGAAGVARGVLRGVGDIRVPALFGILTAWIATPPLAFLLGDVAGLGALGGWIGLCVEIVALAALCWARLLRGSWQHHAAQSRAELDADTPLQAVAA